MLTMAIPEVEISVTCSFAVWFKVYSPDGTNVYGSKGGEFEGMVSVRG